MYSTYRMGFTLGPIFIRKPHNCSLTCLRLHKPLCSELRGVDCRKTLTVNANTSWLQVINKASLVQRYIQLAMSLFKGASRSVIRATARRPAPVCIARRAISSSIESQQKVCSQGRFSWEIWLLTRWTIKLLTADLEQADPAVYKILQNVRRQIPETWLQC